MSGGLAFSHCQTFLFHRELGSVAMAVLTDSFKGATDHILKGTGLISKFEFVCVCVCVCVCVQVPNRAKEESLQRKAMRQTCRTQRSLLRSLQVPSNGSPETIRLFKNKCGGGGVPVTAEVICVTTDTGRGGRGEERDRNREKK